MVAGVEAAFVSDPDDAEDDDESLLVELPELDELLEELPPPVLLLFEPRESVR